MSYGHLSYAASHYALCGRSKSHHHLYNFENWPEHLRTDARARYWLPVAGHRRAPFPEHGCTATLSALPKLSANRNPWHGHKKFSAHTPGPYEKNVREDCIPWNFRVLPVSNHWQRFPKEHPVWFPHALSRQFYVKNQMQFCHPASKLPRASLR